MRRFFPLLLLMIVLTPILMLTACCSEPQYASVSAVPVQQAAPVVQQQPYFAQPSACSQAAPSACSQAAPQYFAQPQTQLVMAQPTGVKIETGVPEVTRAGLAIPGNLVVCFGNFLRCSMEALFPTPTPSMSYTYAPLAPAPAPQYFAPRMVPYCAPPQYGPIVPPQAAPTPQKAPGCEPPPTPVACVGVECLPPQGSR
jgi:hypothetical protein